MVILQNLRVVICRLHPTLMVMMNAQGMKDMVTSPVGERFNIAELAILNKS